MRWCYLASFVAAVIICLILSSLLTFALLHHVPRWWKVVLFVVPQILLFGYAGREMIRSHRDART